MGDPNNPTEPRVVATGSADGAATMRPQQMTRDSSRMI